MPSATKKPTTTKPAAPDPAAIAARVADDQAALLKAAEALLRKLDAEVGDQRLGPGGLDLRNEIRLTLTAGERQIFRGLGWDNMRVSRELTRVRKARRTIAERGTADEQRAASTRLKAAEKAAADDLPTIEQQLADLQAQADGIRREADEAAADVARREAAAARLREFVPAWIRDSPEIAEAIAEQRAARVARKRLEVRLQRAKQARGVDWQDREPVTAQPAPIAVLASDGEPIHDAASWAQVAKRLTEEIPEIQAEIEELRSLEADAKAKQNRIFDEFWS